MKIAFNPSTVAALTTPPNNKDITFDLRGQNIFARGVKFCGTDTNTWRDIKINNVSIGSNILDLRNGSNTTLTNTNGVVTINSTWRPVVDNLTSNSTTSSLSANQGRILAGLINGKSDSDHNHDGRYVKRSGDTMLGALNFANGTWNLIGDDSYIGDCNVSGHLGIKAANTTYPGIAFWNNSSTFLGNLTAYNGNIKYGAYSLQFLDNGNTSVNASTWTNPFSNYNSNAVADGQAICVWGQSSYLSNLANDTGDMSLWLRRGNAKLATLNMVLDGEYYANGNQRLAHVSEIPNSLKNPYSLTTFGVVYDGSAAKVVGPSNFISQVTEGTSTVTDGTMLITSYASNNGFADTNAVNVPYKRKAIHLWEYIKAKTDSLYATKGHNHDDRYLKLIGGTMSGNARIGHGSGNLYIGNSGNDGWLAVQNICSQDSIGDGKWSIRVDGTASFQSIKFSSNRLIAQVSSDSNSPLKGIKLPNLGSNAIGIFSRVANPTNEGGIVLSEDTCVIYNSFDAGWGLSVRDKDLNTTDISSDYTVAFGIRQNYKLYSRGGFEKKDSSDSYVLLGGGGHKTLSDFASSSHSHNYAANENYGGFTKSGRLPISGFYDSNESSGGGNAPWSSWMHLINCQHRNTNNNYALQIAASFYDNNTFKIRVTNNNVNNVWRDIIHSGNIGSQSVNYANSAGNANTLGGIPRNYGQNPFGTIPWIGNDGVMEIGKYIDFHNDNSDSYNYSTRLQVIGNYRNTINLPSESGTLALTSYGGDDSTPIFLGYLNLDHGSDGTISSSFYCLGYSVSFTYTRGGNYCKIVIPDTTRLSFYINAAIASVNYSGGGMDTWAGYHRGTGAWWLHCYAVGWNEVRVKGFRLADDKNDSWWGGNPLWSGNDGANRITVCIFGHVRYK